MTPEEAIKKIQARIDTDFLNNEPFPTELEMAIEALEKADKYAWHDLRKDPTDLPPCEHEVEIAYKGFDHIGTARAIYEDGKMHSDYSDFCYTELDDWCEYCEETDDYIIPYGWFENTKFAENMGIVDVEVIAWRELEPFKEGEE